jgi:hypothetical protein
MGKKIEVGFRELLRPLMQRKKSRPVIARQLNGSIRSLLPILKHIPPAKTMMKTVWMKRVIKTLGFLNRLIPYLFISIEYMLKCEMEDDLFGTGPALQFDISFSTSRATTFS